MSALKESPPKEKAVAKKKPSGPSKSVRFEVFKRDSFKCQYCGRSAPEIVLHLDHIQPRATGGKETILNYVTSCLDCNLGKGPRELSDASAIEVQRKQLDELNERREQIEMMLAWKNDLVALTDRTVQEVEKRINTLTGWGLSDNGRESIKKWLRLNGLSHVMDAIEIASEHLRFDPKAEKKACTPESFDVFFGKVNGIARTKKQAEKEPDLPRLYYARGILRQRFYLSTYKHGEVLTLLRRAVAAGVPVEELVELARTAYSVSDFCLDVEARTSEERAG